MKDKLESLNNLMNSTEPYKKNKSLVREILVKTHENMVTEKTYTEEICSHSFAPLETIYYEVILRNPEDLDDVRVRLYEYFECTKCGVGFYHAYTSNREQTDQTIRSKESLLRDYGLLDVHKRGEPWIEREVRKKSLI